MAELPAADAPTLEVESPAGYPEPAPARERAADVLAGGPARLGHHVLLHELGRGGMGVVYAAYDERLDRKVAIKVLHRADELAAQRRLVREAQALARLSHPNVVQIYEIGDVDGHAFLAMEFLDGGTLRRWLAERPRSRGEILAAFTGAGRGLAAAHASSLIHRDFKPDNVMLHRDGRVLVTDFGLVRGAETLEAVAPDAPIGALQVGMTRAGSILGTPGYMPPEQFLGRETDARSDQFSFCVSLWEALHGARPFTGEDARAVEDAILGGELTEPPRADVPPWLRQILVRGMAVEPVERWRSMDELLDALARDPTPRRRALLGLGAVAAALLALGGGLAIRASRAHADAVAGCEQAGGAIAGDWNDDVAATLHGRFLATGRAHAAEDWSHTRASMDTYASGWSALATRMCREARVDGAREEASYAEIAGCLDERRAAFAGLVEAWSEVDARSLRMAASAAAGLPSVSSCLDAAVLARTARVPAELRSTVVELERRLQRITAQRLAGDHAGALARSQALLPEAVAGGWLPLVAQVRLEIGVAQTEHGWYELARRTLEEAFVDATSAGDELGMAESATKLTHLVGHALGQAGQSRVWGRVAAALLARLGLAGSVRGGTLLNSLGSVALKQSAHDEALEYYQRALVIHETALGERHPTVATTLNNIATVLRLQGRYAESLAPYRRGLEIREAVQGPDHPALAYHLHGLGLSHLALGDLAAARVELERAVALRETAGEAAKLAASRLGLAKVLYAGDERARARELGAAARDGFREAGPGSEADLARAEAWLREHAE